MTSAKRLAQLSILQGLRFSIGVLGLRFGGGFGVEGFRTWLIASLVFARVTLVLHRGCSEAQFPWFVDRLGGNAMEIVYSRSAARWHSAWIG